MTTEEMICELIGNCLRRNVRVSDQQLAGLHALLAEARRVDPTCALANVVASVVATGFVAHWPAILEAGSRIVREVVAEELAEREAVLS